MAAVRASWLVAGLSLPILLLNAGCSSVPAPTLSASPSQRPMFSGTKTEWTQAMVACMQKKGVKATFKVDDEGAPTVEVNDSTSGDSSAGQAAWNACRDELPARPEPKSDADFKVMFDNLVAQSKCVQGEGYEVPPTPSWQSFLEQARAKSIDWDPTSRVPEQLRSSARKACIDQDKWW